MAQGAAQDILSGGKFVTLNLHSTSVSIIFIIIIDCIYNTCTLVYMIHV